MQKKFFIPVLISFLSSNILLAKEVLVDRICALVDSEPILLSEVQDKIEHGPLVRFSDYSSSAESNDEFTRALNDSINARIIMRKAEELDIQVKDEQVENQITQILAEGKFSRESLKDYLAKQGKDYDQYKKDIRDQMVFMRFKGRVIVPTIKINERDIEAYFLKKQGSTPEAAEVSLLRIAVPVENQLLANEKEKLANEIYEKLKSGLTFEEAQTLYASGDQAKTVQVFQQRDLDPMIRSHLKDLKVGEFTKPIRLSAAFVLFYIKDKRLVGSQEFSRQKNDLERELHGLEVVRQTNLWLQTERNRSKITIIKE